MSQSLSCPLCGAALDSSSAKACAKCGGRLISDSEGQALAAAKSRIGDYFLECHIGSGGMGEVYLARQISMKREVALKILLKELCRDKKYLDRFFREVRILAQIEHPNIVRAIEAGMDGDTCYFSMEYAHGKDLKRQIDLGRRFTEDEALQIAIKIATALKFVWDKHRLIHRDVKPANVILSADGELKLMDLGISKREFESSDLTLDGMLVGSPTYISPEQARAEKTIDFRADMYSLGASLFHMLAGEPPYDAGSPVAVISMHLSAPVPELRERRPGISKASSDMILRMMQKDRAARFASWDEAIEQMESIAERRSNATRKKLAVPPHPAAAEPERQRPRLSPAAALKRMMLQLRTQPTHRRIALMILLALMLLMLTSLVKRSIREVEADREMASLRSVLAMVPDCKPELRAYVLTQLESIARNSSLPEARSQALDAIDSMRKSSMAQSSKLLADRKASALRLAKERSFKCEQAGRYGMAMKVWQDLRRNSEFGNDQDIVAEHKKAMDYLIRQQRQAKEGGFNE